MGREATTDVLEGAEGNPVLIGQIPLEMMDWVVDMRNKKLIGNPAHGGEHILEVLSPVRRPVFVSTAAVVRPVGRLG
jgi:hypothetical protein